MTTITQAKAVIYRLSEVFKMEEYHTSRQKSVDQDKPAIKIENGQYSWGFRISEREEKMNKAKNHVKLAVETTQTSVLSNISIELMPKDLLVVVGKIGSGKTSLLNTIMDETVK
jgi:ABC-type bacteriocin/lantibiotic exporter with double-glycine peptidase domain